MAETRRFKLICGLLYPSDEETMEAWARTQLESLFGSIERISERLPWKFTDYYRSISPDLTKIFYSFAGLRDAADIVEWKRAAIALEAMSSRDGTRRVNADPGYMDPARVVLASTKDSAQRIYISDGIYAEVTMCRKDGRWEKFFYTFPDFRSGAYDEFFDAVKDDWRRDMRRGGIS